MVNNCVIQGRMVAAPELKVTSGGASLCSFRVCWSEKYKDKESVAWITCKAWRTTGEFIDKYFTKGQEIMVEGKMLTNSWTDNDGNNRSMLELQVERAHFCGSKKDNPGSGGGDAASAGTFANEPYVPVPESDLPF